MIFSVFTNLCFCALVLISVGDEEKRILLNDPDVVSNRLVHLESTQRQLLDVISALNNSMSGILLENGKLKRDIVTLNSKMSEVQSENIKLNKQCQHPKASGHGSSYVRWGRTQCTGSQTELVYSGYAAGQNYYHSEYNPARFGGPANTLCLPDDPQMSNVSFTNTVSLIRGTEYEQNTFASNSHDEDMPCAVCRSTDTTSAIMIPGRQTCYTGWKLEYEGFLGSGHEGHTASEYICVDSKPEYIPSGKADLNGHLVYMVGIKCGPLPCPPYEDSRKVNCIVCSK